MSPPTKTQPPKTAAKGPTHRRLYAGAVAAVVVSIVAYRKFNAASPAVTSGVEAVSEVPKTPSVSQVAREQRGGEISTPSGSAPVPAMNVMAPAASKPAPWSEEARAERQKAYPKCRDKANECPMWAASGECDKNAQYMKVSCALSCDTCEWAVFETRCKKDPNLQLTKNPGELNAMFERIAHTDEFAHLKPKVVSQPPEPWLIMFDEFLEPEVADAIVGVATREEGKHFTPSHGTGGLDADGQLIPTTSSYRTSSTNWCNEGCLDTAPMVHLRERVVKVTGVPDENHEYPQMLRYYEGQYYKEHSDYIPAHKDMPCGPRILTLFVYLTDVEKGGHTSFPPLNASVNPKKGRAVLWPSVFDDKPTVCDMRTQHIANPVVNGTKYSVNFWIHQHDFKAANKIGCTG